MRKCHRVPSWYSQLTKSCWSWNLSASLYLFPLNHILCESKGLGQVLIYFFIRVLCHTKCTPYFEFHLYDWHRVNSILGRKRASSKETIRRLCKPSHARRDRGGSRRAGMPVSAGGHPGLPVLPPCTLPDVVRAQWW